MSNFPDYEFRENGEVFSKLSSKVLKPSVNSRGYHTYRLKNKEGNFITKSAHRLFAERLLPSFDNNLQVNHLDGNKLNNSIDNLEMVTASENMKHAVIKGLLDNSKNNTANYGYKVLLECLNTGKKTNHGTLGKALQYLGYSNGYSSWNRVKKTTKTLKNHKITLNKELFK